MNNYNPINLRYGHRCYVFSTTGTIIYNPNNSKRAEPFWCIIDIEKDITRYYRELFKKKTGIILHSPAFDAHVSVLKGLEQATEKMKTHWEYLNGKIVEVHYDPNIYWNEKHVWINTYCKEYFDLREYYGVLDWNTKDFSHLTIGKFTSN